MLPTDVANCTIDHYSSRQNQVAPLPRRRSSSKHEPSLHLPTSKRNIWMDQFWQQQRASWVPVYSRASKAPCRSCEESLLLAQENIPRAHADGERSLISPHAEQERDASCVLQKAGLARCNHTLDVLEMNHTRRRHSPDKKCS